MVDKHDPLAQFRRQTPQQDTGQPRPTAPTAPPQQQPEAKTQEATAPFDEELQPPPRQFDAQSGKEIYRAFFVWSRRRERLEIRQTLGAWLYPRYFDLRDIIRSGYAATEIVLPFPNYDVFITGRNLQQLVYTLAEGRCYYIADFNPNQHARITEPDAPIIESMAAVTRDTGVKQPFELKGNTTH